MCLIFVHINKISEMVDFFFKSWTEWPKGKGCGNWIKFSYSAQMVQKIFLPLNQMYGHRQSRKEKKISLDVSFSNESISMAIRI